MDRRAFLKTVAALPAATLVSSLARDALAAERAAPPPAFAHLHVHTRYSIVDSATRIEDLVARARELSLTALAITDHANLFGAVHFHDACIAAGVRPIIGCELYVARSERADPVDRRHLTLLAANLEGYRNLCRLATAARAEPDRVRAVTHGDLRERSAGLIALSGCLSGDAAAHLLAGDRAAARRAIEELASIFPGRSYVELQATEIEEQEAVNAELASLARTLGLPIVASNDCHYVRKDDADSHEVLACASSRQTLDAPDRWRPASRGLHLKSPAEMAAAFADRPEAIASTIEIAKRIELELPRGRLSIPALRGPNGESPAVLLRRRAIAGLEARLAKTPPADAPPDANAYLERLEYELGVVESAGCAAYLHLIADLTRGARRRGITCGSTWGMAPGSLLAWSLEITQLDPLAHGLSFERFLNPERPSIPSIAIDVDRSGREELARLARERYGPDHVARVGLFVARRGRRAIVDAGCVLGISENDVGRIREAYPERHWMPIDEALVAAPLLRGALNRSDRLRETLRHARYLEGSVEWVATHAAELLVGDRPLADEIPLFVDDEGALATQYDRDSLEKLGIASLVVIGSPDLSLVGATLARIRAEQGKELDLAELSLDDPDAYALLRKGACGHSRCGDTARLRRVMIEVEPARFTDLMAVMALERRGADEWPVERGSTLSEIFLERRRSGRAVRDLHASLEPILRETYGIILYQEQVNAIVRDMTGARPGEADLIRQVFVRRRTSELDAERRRFVGGAERHGFSRRLARRVFERVSTYGAYAFSRSAAASAALLHYRLAYLAAHHPRETEWARAQCESADMA